MKKTMILLSRLLATAAFSVLSCKNAADTLIWTDPPSSADTVYQNPLFEPDLADPSFIRANDGWFYAYGTENTWSPGVERIAPIVRSKNMRRWEFVANGFAVKPSWKSTGWIWAPQIVFRNGTYYLYYSFSAWNDNNPGVGVATSEYPYGPFTDQGKIFDTQSSGVANSIDQFFIETGSGRNKKMYIFWGSFQGIYGVEMTDEKTANMATKFRIAGNSFEGSYIYPKKLGDTQYYFYFGSLGNCCEGANSQYRLGVARATSITGPYLNKNGENIMNNDVQGTPFLVGNDVWVGPGHNAEIIMDDKEREFILYHAIQKDNPLLPNGATRRPLCMDEIKWTNDGWPYIEGNSPSIAPKRAPYFAPATQ